MDVLGLSHRQVMVAVDQHDLRADSTHHHGIGRGAADEAGSDNSDFHGLILPGLIVMGLILMDWHRAVA